MAMQQEAIFEAPAAHEAGDGSGEASFEGYGGQETGFEFEWELHEASHHAQPEMSFEEEFGAQETYETDGYAGQEWSGEWEDEGDPFLGGAIGGALNALGFEAEEEYAGQEWAGEWEDEGDAFFGKALKRLGRLAKRFAPSIVGKLAGMIPGVGAIAGPLAGKLTAALVREGEQEAAQFEMAAFGAGEVQGEIAPTEAAQEAALTELIAAEATLAESEAEAEATLAAALPITITIMGGRRALRPVVPVLAQANGRLVQSIRRQGPEGRQLLRLVPTIQRQAVGTLRAAARTGQPISGPLAVRAMAAATQQVLGDPRRVQRAVARNLILRRRTAPPTPRRAQVFMPSRVAPYHPRRAAGYRPMRAARPPYAW